MQRRSRLKHKMQLASSAREDIINLRHDPLRPLNRSGDSWCRFRAALRTARIDRQRLQVTRREGWLSPRIEKQQFFLKRHPHRVHNTSASPKSRSRQLRRQHPMRRMG